jgi:hypothetical protein
MWPDSHNVDDIFINITKDIASFANPNSITQSRKSPSKIELAWEIGRDKKRATFIIDSSRKLKVEYKGTKYTYSDFLCSQEMADLQLFAERMCATLPAADDYVFTKSRQTTEDGTKEDIIENIILDLVQSPIYESQSKDFIDATRVVFIRGQAGAGKSVAMRMLTRSQAEKFKQGKSDFLFFYVDAQGRALSRLYEAFAMELQKLIISNIRYNTINALVRNRILIPIIDGFDELIGSGGFTDAFSSLSVFLASLERSGSVLATGRSSFYDDKKFSNIAEKYSQSDSINYRFDTVELLGWGEEELKIFLSTRYTLSEYGKAAATNFLKYYNKTKDSNKRLLEKPFYCVSLANIIEHNPQIIKNEDDLLEILVNYLLEREVHKLMSKQGMPILPLDGHIWLLKQLALEMWWQEIRFIDKDTLLAIAEMVSEEFKLPHEYWPILSDRISFYAFLKSGGDLSADQREFESDIYYDFFLLKSLIDLIDKGSMELEPFLSRSLLGESLLESLEREAKKRNADVVSKWIKLICASLSRAAFGGIERRNGGGLIAALIKGRADLPNGIVISNVEFYKRDISGLKLDNAIIRNSFFQDTRMLDCHITNSQILDTLFDRIIIDKESTNFSGTKLFPGKAITSVISDNITIYAPNDLLLILKQINAELPASNNIITLTAPQKRALNLLQRFLYKMNFTLYFDAEANNEVQFKSITRDTNWIHLFRILTECDILVRKILDRSGPRGYLYRLVEDPDSVLRGINSDSTPNIEEFWKKFFSTF